MMKQTLFTIILLLLTIVIVKSQQNIFLIPRHINLELLDLKSVVICATSECHVRNCIYCHVSTSTYMVINNIYLGEYLKSYPIYIS